MGNPKLELARRIIENTGASLFLTGRAGTGKTTFLHDLRSSTRKRVVVAAPTGIAAINAGGVTLHSLFQLDFGIFVPGQAHHEKFRMRNEKMKIIRGMDLLVIDEVSMVRADVLDAVDDSLRRLRDRNKPFGGVQLLLIGDLQQLPPVAREEEESILRKYYPTNYFFESHALKQLDYETVELDRVYRQNDAEFLDILNAIRDNRVDDRVLARLNSRVPRKFIPDDYDGYIRLTTHNRLAAEINAQRLDRLPTPETCFEARVEGKFPESMYPADPQLRLKVGTQVMFIKNDIGFPRAYYNGMIGEIVAIDEENGVAVRPMEGGDIITVGAVEWSNNTYAIDEKTSRIVEKREGSFFQIPLRPAWAVTIHKCQGLTFDRAIVDVSRSFAHGQAYVALSRCRNLQGLVLERPVTPSAIISDRTVESYLDSHCNRDITEERMSELERAYRVSLLDQLFSFRILFAAMEGVVRILAENFARYYPSMVSDWSSTLESKRQKVNAVADKFRTQYVRMAMSIDPADAAALQQRVRAAANYFLGTMQPLSKLVAFTNVESQNKHVKQKLADRLELFSDLLKTKVHLLNTFRSRDFDADTYLDVKAAALLQGTPTPKTSHKPVKTVAKSLKDPKPVAPAPVEKPKAAKEKKKKVEKIPSSRVTADMVRKGMTVEEIMDERNLSQATVIGHIRREIPIPELKKLLPVLVSPEALPALVDYACNNPERSLTVPEIIETLPGEPTYEEACFVFRAYGSTYKSPEVVQEPPEIYGKPEDFIQAEVTD